MEAVYAGSFITLAAAEAVDSWDGFLATRDPLQQEDCWVNLKESGPVVKFSRAIPRKYFGEYNLDQRGWVFQERLLSPRSVYFSPHGVEWECRQSTTTTDEFVSSKDILLMGQLSKRIYTPLVQLENLRSSKDLARFQRHWNDVVMQYSRTTLSYAFDKLPALAGAAAIAQRKFKITASFGLWLRFFTSELLWATAGDEAGQRVPGRAPSWSWASIEGAVEKHHVLDKYLFSRTEQEYTAKVIVAPAATSFTKPPRTWEPVKLRGPLVPCILKIHEAGGTLLERNSPFHISKGAMACVDDNGVYRMRSFSADIDLETDQRLACLLVKRICYSERGGSLSGDGTGFTKFVVRDVGLVLAPTGAHCCQYERVGLYDESAEKVISDSISDSEPRCQLLPRLLRTLGMFPTKSGVQSKVVEMV